MDTPVSTPVKLSTRNDGWWIFRDVIARNEEFTASNFRGVTEFKGFGQYAPFDAVEAATIRSSTYFIYSYDTLIAWRMSSGAWVRNATRYSVTTSKHQGLVACATENL